MGSDRHEGRDVCVNWKVGDGEFGELGLDLNCEEPSEGQCG